MRLAIQNPHFRCLTPQQLGVYIRVTSPPWVSTPGRKVAPFGAAFAFSGGNAPAAGGPQ